MECRFGQNYPTKKIPADKVECSSDESSGQPILCEIMIASFEQWKKVTN
jgi:hypothetical protein